GWQNDNLPRLATMERKIVKSEDSILGECRFCTMCLHVSRIAQSRTLGKRVGVDRFRNPMSRIRHQRNAGCLHPFTLPHLSKWSRIHSGSRRQSITAHIIASLFVNV